MTYQTLELVVDDRVASLTLNRPERMNAFTEELLVEFKQAIAAVEKDEAVRVIIVSGAGGKAFSAGYDLRDGAEAPKRSIAELNERYDWQQTFNLSVWHCSKPVIAMIDGYCLAGALELAACCDIRYCSDTSRIGALEARFGGGMGTLMLPWILGNKCRELVYTGDILPAEDALRIGLVDRVFPQADLAAETMRIAKRMSRVAASCQTWNKRAINQTFEIMGLHSALRHGIDAASILRAIGSPERETFDELRRTEGLAVALAWRKSLFAPFE
ncbi:enoyl-CoA hydratase/isomerase family protein [Limobrevibacterium gyesilva]|uniref:Enoyl-CoA hydratase/isomerase family protein n=1 Tax=Limobrevibacterium gyesilva TaxID=2991712 RepID=A0AA42CI18_9PROT|nr:enoyl-CoA hydratase/isomerase family protein [Limobrevibacterium gyesilva]MCW3475517.1 enoyl-CoA hydratase/isomerase family protein [Limobrevibacterium gyesilva]